MRRSFLCVFALCGCASAPENSRWSRHFEAPVIGGAFAAQFEGADQYVPEAVLLATIPVSFAYDHDVQKHEDGRALDSSTKFAASALQVVLPAIPVTIGVVDWAQGDGGRRFEVVAETLGGVVLVQQLLANTIGRERPNGQDSTSFPSGHTAWAFAATTLIVRGLHDPADRSFHFFDTLLYVPAVFSAWERIAAQKHWASDVTCGALLGVVLTNWIWNAHYAGAEDSRPTIYGERRARGIAWRPSLEVIDGQLALGVTGGF